MRQNLRGPKNRNNIPALDDAYYSGFNQGLLAIALGLDFLGGKSF